MVARDKEKEAYANTDTINKLNSKAKVGYPVGSLPKEKCFSAIGIKVGKGKLTNYSNIYMERQPVRITIRKLLQRDQGK